MSFDTARAKHLSRLDAEYAALRKVAASPDWTNPEYSEFKKVMTRLHDVMMAICRLNAAQSESEKD